MKKLYIVIIAIISILITTIITVCYTIGGEELDNLVDATADDKGNMYYLNHDTGKEQYKLSTGSSSGRIKNTKILDNAEEGLKRSYDMLEVDSLGNILVKATDVKLDSNGQSVGIISEKIYMYDMNMKFIKELVSVDLSTRGTLPSYSYIFNFHTVGDKVTVFCKDGNNYEVLTTDTTTAATPEVRMTFSIIPDINVSKEIKWVNDIVYSSTGKIFYSDNRGQMYIVDENGSKNITAQLGVKNAFSTIFSIDSNDNVYFTDITNQAFYKLNLNNLNLALVYNSNSIINKKHNITFGELTYANLVGDGQFYGILKTTQNNFHIMFGANENYIRLLRHGAPILKLIVALGVGAIIFAGLYGLLYFIFRFKEKRSLRLKIVLSFLPVYLVSMGIIVVVLVNTIILSNSDKIINSQGTCAKVISDSIDGDLFASINSNSKFLTDDYIKLYRQVDTGFQRTQAYATPSTETLTTYIVQDGIIYQTIKIEKDYSGTHSANLDANFKDRIAPIFAIDYNMDKETVQKYYSAWGQLNGKSNSQDIQCSFEIKDNGVEWIVSCEPIFDSNGNTVGFLESKVAKWANVQESTYKAIAIILGMVFGITVLIFIYFFIVLKFSFAPLKELNKCVQNIGEGKWNTKVNITSKDELADIGRGFNVMTNKINQYVSSFIILNQEYKKFVPSQLFKLLGKNKITEISLNDRSYKKVNILSVDFDIKEDDYHNINAADAYFEKSNHRYVRLFDIIEANRGVVEKFDAFGMTVLFQSATDIISASMQIQDQLGAGSIKDNYKLSLGASNATIGVMGNDARVSIAIISEELMLMDYVNRAVEKMNIKHFALQSLINEIDPKFSSQLYRFIGQIKHPKKDEPIRIYEFMDTKSLYEKKLYLGTKSMFEEGVAAFIKGNLVGARKLFSDVLKINELDKMAMYYLGLCDEFDYQKSQNWRGYLT